MNQYLEVFIEESKEHLQNVNDQLMRFEKNIDDLSYVNEIFRSAHTLKGMSATMGFDDLAQLTHKMENVLDAVRNHQLDAHTEVLDALFESVDALEIMVQSISEGGDGQLDVKLLVQKLQRIVAEEPVAKHAASSIEYDELVQALLSQTADQGFNAFEITVQLESTCLLKAARAYMVFDVLEQAGDVIKSAPTVQDIEQEKFESSFIVILVTNESQEKLQTSIMEVSEVESVNIAAVPVKAQTEMKEPVLQAAAAIQEVTVSAPSKSSVEEKKQPSSNKTIRVNIDRLDSLMNLFEELVIDRGRLEQISKELNNSQLDETVERMSRISGDLQTIILNMRMVPVETVFNRFPRMVRQLSKDLGKQIELQIVGADTELDRTVIDEIGDPLVHLLRNAVDHGIEMPQARLKNGKNEKGTIRLKAYHSGNHVFIDLEDDGAGINREKVLQKALDRGIIDGKTAETLTDRQVYELIFASGFSTAEQISDVSGRGVGLDVVKNTIESLGGSVTIDSNEGYGSRFSIQLPLTLSIISALLVQMSEERYALPLSSIIETAIVQPKEVMHVHGQKVIDFRGAIIPLIDLKELFNVPNSVQGDHYSVVIVKKRRKRPPG